MITKQFPKFLLILGKKSVDLFNYFKVDELHGLSKEDAEKYPETKNDAYIMGMCNYIPKKSGEYKSGDALYLFINMNRLNDTYKDYTAIMHECFHLSLSLNNWNVNKEERIVSDAEMYANEIIGFILKEKMK
jgi:hypothetical protein